MTVMAVVNLLTTDAKGDIVIIAAGVFFGNLAWGVLRGGVRWFLASYDREELERSITRAILEAETRARTREGAKD